MIRFTVTELVILAAACIFIGGAAVTTMANATIQKQAQALERHEHVREVLKDAGAYRWCEMVLAEEVDPK